MLLQEIAAGFPTITESNIHLFENIKCEAEVEVWKGCCCLFWIELLI